MTWENEASPSISSARPGAAGSTDIAAIIDDDADRSTITTFASRAIRRASVSAVSVMLSFEAVPRTVTLRAASPALRKSSASRAISVNAAGTSGPASRKTGAGSGSGGAIVAAIGARTGAGAGTNSGEAANAAGARGAVIRSNSAVTITPALNINVANVAISTIGSFLG